MILAKQKSCDREVAVKRIVLYSPSVYQVKKLLREVVIMKELNAMKEGDHHFVELYDVFLKENKKTSKLQLFLVMEYVEMNLREFLSSENSSDLS